MDKFSEYNENDLRRIHLHLLARKLCFKLASKVQDIELLTQIYLEKKAQKMSQKIEVVWENHPRNFYGDTIYKAFEESPSTKFIETKV